MKTISPGLNHFGGQSMVHHLQTVLVRRPNSALGNADPNTWHYLSRVDLNKALKEHDQFVEIMKQHQVDIIYHDELDDTLADAIFVHDPMLMTDHGAIILRMGKALRQGEEALMKQKMQQLNIPILGEIAAPGLVEGGDLLWLDEKTLLAGIGFRTNEVGIQQLRNLLQPHGIEVIAFDLPYFQGQDACLHLQSLISLVDIKAALIYLPLLPVRLLQLLMDKSFTLIEVPEEEFMTMGPNTLALKPKLVLSLAGNPMTTARLQTAGITVVSYQGAELSLKTEGGPTCLTRPIKRSNMAA